MIQASGIFRKTDQRTPSLLPTKLFFYTSFGLSHCVTPLKSESCPLASDLQVRYTGGGARGLAQRGSGGRYDFVSSGGALWGMVQSSGTCTLSVLICGGHTGPIFLFFRDLLGPVDVVTTARYWLRFCGILPFLRVLEHPPSGG